MFKKTDFIYEILHMCDPKLYYTIISRKKETINNYKSVLRILILYIAYDLQAVCKIQDCAVYRN